MSRPGRAVPSRPSCSSPPTERVGFLRTTTGDDISVVPTDVAPLVASGEVDEQLFNLSALNAWASTTPPGTGRCR